MRFYTNQHKYYCGIDLHANTMYVCVVDSAGKIVLHRNMRTDGEYFLKVLEPYRQDVIIGVECMFCWYWIADLCAEQGIAFVLGHALYMKAIHGGKAKNDKIDSEKIARLLRGGTFPLSYTYPKDMRATRDLMRRRLFMVHKRAELYAHVQITYQQYNQRPPGVKLAYRANREKLEKPFLDESVKKAVEADLVMIEHYSKVIRELEWYIEKTTKHSQENALAISLLQTVPGIGPILSATILYEIHDISRFPSVQQFSSYARLVKPDHQSGGKSVGSGCKKIGNHHLRWAFSEAVVIFIRDNEKAKNYLKRMQRRFSKSKALTILAHKLARAVYYILLRQEAWNEQKFLAT